MRYATTAAVVIAGIAMQTSAQEKPSGDGPRFEVASVKPNNAGGTQRVDIQADRVSIVNVTLRTVIGAAFGISVVGGPGWIGDERGPGGDRFDVMAKAEAPASRDER